MNKFLSTAVFCFACVRLLASEPWYEYDFSYVNKLPELRKHCLELNQLEGTDGIPDIRRKQFAYYECLKEMISQVMKRHYFHDEFPDSPIKVIDDYAKLLAGAEYPQSAATGASFYGGLIIDHQIRLAEDLLVRMVGSILDMDSYGDEGPINDLTIKEWLALWNEAQKSVNKSLQATAANAPSFTATP